jgi:hypothetical protein
MKIVKHSLLVLICFLFLQNAVSQTGGKATDGRFTIENYYKVKWGSAEEFIELWKKNHYPLLKKAMEKGDILQVVAEKPKLHSSEDSRWDFKVIITFKNAALAFDPNLTTPYKASLYPDAAKLVKDEQYRFSLLLAHWDVMVDTVSLDFP